MDQAAFFTFSSEYKNSIIQAHPIGLKNNNGRSESIDLLLGTFNNLIFPISFKQEHGKKFADILDTGNAFLNLVSNRFLDVLSKNGLKGWERFEIRLLDKNDNELTGYSGLSVTGRSGPIFYNDSTVFEKALIENGPKSNIYKGYNFDLETWDNSDFFIPKGSFHILISSKAAEIISKSNFTNVRLEKISEVETWDYIVGSYNDSFKDNFKYF